MRAVLASTTLPNWFSMLDKYLANLSDSYCVVSSLTIADLKLSVLVKSGVLDSIFLLFLFLLPCPFHLNLIYFFAGIPGEIIDPFPRLVEVNEQEDERVK
jgi:hypothetical protein